MCEALINEISVSVCLAEASLMYGNLYCSNIFGETEKRIKMQRVKLCSTEEMSLDCLTESTKEY